MGVYIRSPSHRQLFSEYLLIDIPISRWISSDEY